MHLHNFKKISINGIEMQELSIGGVQIWKSGPTNLMPLSIEADGTPYNGGLGYKEGYRVRSGGAEAYYSTLSFCTGFIPYQAGQTVRMYSPYGFGSDGAVPSVTVYDTNKTVLGQAANNGKYGIITKTWSNLTAVDENGIISLSIPQTETRADEIAWIRLTLILGTTPSNISAGMAETVITINEEIL